MIMYYIISRSSVRGHQKFFEGEYHGEDSFFPGAGHGRGSQGQEALSLRHHDPEHPRQRRREHQEDRHGHRQEGSQGEDPQLRRGYGRRNRRQRRQGPRQDHPDQAGRQDEGQDDQQVGPQARDRQGRRESCGSGGCRVDQQLLSKRRLE